MVQFFSFSTPSLPTLPPPPIFPNTNYKSADILTMSQTAPVSPEEAMRIQDGLRTVDVEVRLALATGRYEDLAAAYRNGVDIHDIH